MKKTIRKHTRTECILALLLGTAISSTAFAFNPGSAGSAAAAAAAAAAQQAAAQAAAASAAAARQAAAQQAAAQQAAAKQAAAGEAAKRNQAGGGSNGSQGQAGGSGQASAAPKISYLEERDAGASTGTSRTGVVSGETVKIFVPDTTVPDWMMRAAGLPVPAVRTGSSGTMSAL